MTVLLNNFEGGSASAAITTGNSGGASGNAFDVVFTGSGATTAFDNTHAAHGSLSCEIATTTSSQANVEWTTSLGTLSQVWFRLYLYFTANPAAQVRVFYTFGTAGVFLAVNSGGTLSMVKSSGVTITATSAVIPLNQWFRVEGFVLAGTSTGQTELQLYDSMDSATATEVDTSAANLNLATTTLANYVFGISTNTASAGPYWIDNIGVSSTGYIGPFGYVYYGQETLDYLDYLDLNTGRTLVAVPGSSYLMMAVNSRAGLTVPPPDGRWTQPPGE